LDASGNPQHDTSHGRDSIAGIGVIHRDEHGLPLPAVISITED
jgi:hypothetical protein